MQFDKNSLTMRRPYTKRWRASSAKAAIPRIEKWSQGKRPAFTKKISKQEKIIADGLEG
jgi:hypothetical protein